MVLLPKILAKPSPYKPEPPWMTAPAAMATDAARTARISQTSAAVQGRAERVVNHSIQPGAPSTLQPPAPF
jgi:hypothetical protein